MSPEISERSFEETIECTLLSGGPDACPGLGDVVREVTPAFGEDAPGGYRRRKPEEYDRSLCLIPRDVIDFVQATQPKSWARLKEHYGAEVRSEFLRRLAREIEKRGTLHVLRRGLKDRGIRIRLAYFRPASGLNEELQRLHDANLFAVVRQLKYSEKTEQSLDVALFLNGIPVFTAELKNPLTGQTVQHAIKQYRTDRDPKEPIFRFGRCLAHFAVDPDLVSVATHLAGRSTRFLPFNRGKFGGAGNEPVLEGYATAYLWTGIWARDSVLDLLQHFIHEVELLDDKGKKTGKTAIIFPRYHQLDAVRRLVRDARSRGTGQRYLIQHSAGSGKSNSIAWLAHQLSVLHDAKDQRVFDTIVVITDRRILDRQLQRTVKQFEQTLGVVENIDKTSRQLKEALEGGKTIIVSTLQKFPVIAEQMGALPGHRFAVIIDEAHSSQSGESTKSLKSVLASGDLSEAEKEEEREPEDVEDRLVAEMKKRGPQPNVSTFAFTATPKSKTLELFGARRPDGRFEPFSLYSMRQAIEEKFILDVLANYTTHHVYWKLLKTVEDDPRYDRTKASYLLRSFVDLHEHAVRKKVEIMVEHFHTHSAHRIAGRAKAMIVTRSRLHAVRYRQELDRCLREKGLPYKALVAFSGTVRDGGVDFTESGMNGFSESKTAATFEQPEYRFLVVANKFQTGFDQPLLHTMYVDKKLGGVNAVQTLSRLNRTHPDKEETLVLDFANEADVIQEAFQPYYEKTLLSESTDPNLLYDLQHDLDEADVYTDADLDEFASVWFNPKSRQEQVYAVLRSPLARYEELDEDDQTAFRGKLTDYVRLYAFLSQILTFADAELERLYLFGRMLRRLLPVTKEQLPREVQENVDMESYRITATFQGQIGLGRGESQVDPMQGTGGHTPPVEEIEPLSRIIQELNERFGTSFSEEDRVTIQALEEHLASNEALQAALRANTPANARLTFDHVVTDELQDMVETNFQFYKRVTDDQDFARYFLDWLFDRFAKGAKRGSE